VKILSWLPMSFELGYVVGNGGDTLLAIALVPVPAGWHVMALEALSADALNHHAHRDLGLHKDKALAVDAAETYARAWRDRNSGADECECQDIP